MFYAFMYVSVLYISICEKAKNEDDVHNILPSKLNNILFIPCAGHEQ